MEYWCWKGETVSRNWERGRGSEGRIKFATVSTYRSDPEVTI